MLTSTFTQNDSAAAPQVWIRTKILADGSVYTNDTKRALGHREQFTIRTKEYPQKVGATSVSMVQMNITFERQLSTDVVPFRWSQTFSCPKSLQDSVSTIRILLKDLNMVYNNQLTGTDAKVDDLMAFRTHIP